MRLAQAHGQKIVLDANQKMQLDALGMDYFLKYAREVGAVTSARETELREECWQATS